MAPGLLTGSIFSMPQPICFDRGRIYVKFCFQYEFDGKQWTGDLWAVTQEEAEMKLRAMAGGTVSGVVMEEGPLDPGADHEPTES